MKKLLLSAALCLAYAHHSQAQINKIDDVKKSLQTSNKDTVAWVHGGFINIGANQGFLHNWAAGGEVASFTVNSIFSGHIDRLNNRDIWSNNLDMTYGLNYTYSSGFLPRKTDDRIDFTSKYGHKIDTGKDFYFTTLLNFKSQFTKGYDYTQERWDTTSTSKFLAPAYITLAVGAEYRKGSDISVFFSPLAGRLTLASREYTSRTPQGAFGVPYNKTTFYQFGAYFSGRYVHNINKNTVYKTRLDLYSNYLAKDTKDSNGVVVRTDNPGNINVLFDNLLSWKVSKFLNITMAATFIYDHNFPYDKKTIDKTTGLPVDKDDPGKNLGWLQIKQVFTLGLEYKF